MEGRVEICFNNTYVSICGDRWDTLEARVVCRQLGYNSDSKGHLYSCTLIYKSPFSEFLNDTDVSIRFFEHGFGEVLLTKLMCNGNETFLSDCSSEYTNVCLTGGAGVMCEGMLLVCFLLISMDF